MRRIRQISTDVVVHEVDDEAGFAAWLSLQAPHEADFELLPPDLVPASVTPYQARRALLDAGLLASVEAAVANAPAEIRIAWEYALSIERSSPLILAMGTSLGLSEAQLDGLFMAAAQVNQ